MLLAIERREYLRITLTGKIDIRSKGVTEPLTGLAVNISKGGAAFYSENPFEIKDELLLHIFFKDDSGEKFEEIAGKVRWIKPVGKIFAIGVQFKEISRVTHPLIYSYIEVNDYVPI